MAAPEIQKHARDLWGEAEAALARHIEGKLPP